MRSFNHSWVDRLDRHIPVIGLDVQRRLRSLKTAVFGIGGLGSFVSILLACLGVGELVLVDYDRVSITDLNRQILYSVDYLGEYKCVAAIRRIRNFSPDVSVEGIVLDACSKKVVEHVVRKVDVVFNCLDNPKARVTVNDACVRARRVMIFGGVEDFRGMVMTYIPDVSPCLRCVFRLGSARRVNVLAPSCAVAAALQVMELIRLVRGNYTPTLTYVDLRTYNITTYKLEKPPTCDTCQITRSEQQDLQ